MRADLWVTTRATPWDAHANHTRASPVRAKQAFLEPPSVVPTHVAIRLVPHFSGLVLVTLNTWFVWAFPTVPGRCPGLICRAPTGQNRQHRKAQAIDYPTKPAGSRSPSGRVIFIAQARTLSPQ